MIRSRFVRSFTLVLATFVALSCSEFSPTAPIAAPTQAQDGLISGLLGLVTNLLGSVLKVIVGVVDPNGIEVRPRGGLHPISIRFGPSRRQSASMAARWP